MESLGSGFLLPNAFVFQSKALLCFLPLLLVILARPHLEGLMPTMWDALPAFFQGPAFAFLLLNCLILTILASSKLESEKEGHEEGSTRESTREMEKGNEKEPILAENQFREQISQNSPTENGCNYHRNEGRALLRRSCSLSANFKLEIKQEQIDGKLNEKQLFRRARLACKLGIEKVGLHLNTPLNRNLEEKILVRGSFSFNNSCKGYLENPALEKIISNNVNGKLGRAGNNPEHQAHHTPAAAAMACPSLDEVWSTIVSLNKSDDRMASMQEDQRSEHSNYGNNTNQPLQPAAATDGPISLAAGSPAPPAAAGTPPAASTAARSLLKLAEASPTSPSEPPAITHAAITEKHELDAAVDQASDSELEELNRRVEEFIARFNKQMRLQRQESLQRERGRPCTYDLDLPQHVHRRPVRGLLVGCRIHNF